MDIRFYKDRVILEAEDEKVDYAGILGKLADKAKESESDDPFEFINKAAVKKSEEKDDTTATEVKDSSTSEKNNNKKIEINTIDRDSTEVISNTKEVADVISKL